MLEHSSLVTNKGPDIDHGIERAAVEFSTSRRATRSSGGAVNQHDTVIRFTNQTYLGEMCVVDAEAMGATCSGFSRYSVSSSPYQITIGQFGGEATLDSGEAAARWIRTGMPRPRLARFAERDSCLFGQMVEWPDGSFDDRSGSEKLTE